MVQKYEVRGTELGGDKFYEGWVEVVEYTYYQELEAENQKLREQRDAANATIQQLNRIIAGDVG